MKDLMQAFDDRLRGLFENKAAEFAKYAEEEPTTSAVTAQLAGLYRDLAEAISH
jgi:hypothetical protein